MRVLLELLMKMVRKFGTCDHLLLITDLKFIMNKRFITPAKPLKEIQIYRLLLR